MRYSYEYRDRGNVYTGVVEGDNETAARREVVEVLDMQHINAQHHRVMVTVLADAPNGRPVHTCPRCGHNFAA